MKSSIIKLLPFLVLLFIVLGCSQEAQERRRQIALREKLVSEMNDRYEIRSTEECAIKFRTGDKESKTLVATPCPLMKTERIKITDILTPSTTEPIKSVGFEVVQIEHQNGESEFYLIKR